MITDDVWALCGLLLQVATTWGYDYVQDCIAPLLNYVSKVQRVRLIWPLSSPLSSLLSRPLSVPRPCSTSSPRCIVEHVTQMPP